MFDYVIFAVPLAFVGGVFYYAAFNNWHWGGIGVLGALIGAGIGLVVAKAVYGKLTKKPRVRIIQMLDLACVFFLLGQCIGRIGCYFGKCCYGIAVDFDVFPFSYEVHGVLHLGNPFIESIWCAIGFIPMAIMYLSDRKCFNGFFISLYCIWYGAERFTLEFFRADAEKLVIPGTDFGISQLVSLIMIAFVMCADDRKSDKFVRKADKALRSPGATVYAGGELNTDKASSFEKSIIEGVEAAFKKEGRALPQIMYATLRDLAERIKADLDQSKNDESEKAE